MLVEERRQVEQATGKSVNEAMEDVGHLRNLHQTNMAGRDRIAAIQDGPEGVAKILGIKKGGETPPVANFIYSAMNRLAQKIGTIPDVTVEPHRDSQPAREQAEKIERIVRAYDDGARMDLAMPQMGRWLPGYGFAPIVVTDGYDRDGNPFPYAQLRDPHDAFPSSWGVQSQPDRIAFIRQMDPRRLARIYPEHKADLDRMTNRSGAVILGPNVSQNQGPRGSTVQVAEYIDVNGTWTILEEGNLLLDFTPNPIYPMVNFTVAKRFAFNKLIGHYDQAVGLLLANAKLNLLTLIAMEDAVFAETNIFGELAQGNEYHKGRNAYNFFEPGTTVQKMGSSVSPQMFQEIDRIERQFRVTAGYSVMDDGQSPNSFVTGRGMDSLQGGIDNEVKEYRTVERRALEDVDTIRLAWDEKAYGGVRKPIFGMSAGAKGAEMYRPKQTIAGRWRTKRKDGLLSGLDEPSKVIQMLQLGQAGWLDDLTAMENIDGIDNVPEVRKRLMAQNSRKALESALLGASQQGDPRAVMALIEMLPEDDMKQTLKKYFTPEEPQMSEEESAMAEPPPEPGGPGVGEDDTATVLSRLLSSGEATAGAQVVQR